MRVRNKEINRRRARRRKTKELKTRLQAAGDAKTKAKLAEKLRRINIYLPRS